VVPLALWFGYTSLAKALVQKREKGVTAQTDETQPGQSQE